MLAPEQLHKLAEPDPELTVWLKENPFPGAPWHDLAGMRAMNAAGAERTVAAMGPTPADLEEQIQAVKARDGFELQNRIVRPRTKPAGGSPLILLVHGGGFIMGNNVTQVPLARPLAHLFGAVVVPLHYRLSPEHPFPGPQEDIIDNLKWFAANAEAIGANPEAGFLIGGSSAGGQLTAVATQSYVDEGLSPKLTGLWQNVTTVLAETMVPEKYKGVWLSREDCKDAIILNTKDMAIVEDHLKPDHQSRLFSPFNSPTAHKGMPKTFFQVCGGDPLRDDSFIYEDALKEAGVQTRIEVYPGLPHGFNSLLPGFKAALKWRVDFIRGIGWLLGKEVTDEQLKALSSEAKAARDEV